MADELNELMTTIDTEKHGPIEVPIDDLVARHPIRNEAVAVIYTEERKREMANLIHMITASTEMRKRRMYELWHMIKENKHPEKVCLSIRHTIDEADTELRKLVQLRDKANYGGREHHATTTT